MTEPAKGRKKKPKRPVSTETPRAGRCAIVGRPNVGKSTLMNALLGQKLVIATSKPGTTRSSVLAVYASDEPPTQIAFIDTPGMHRPKSALGEVLVEQAKLGLSDADVVVFLVEAPSDRNLESEREKERKVSKGMSDADREVLALVKESKRPTVLAINKVDRLKDKRFLLPFIELLQKEHDFVAVLPISAQRGTNLDSLIGEVRGHLPEGMLYDESFFTDRPERFFVAELIREAAMRGTFDEVPHGLACVIDQYIEKPGSVRIAATLIVEKESHKSIVIGAQGAKIKQIGTEARQEIERFLEQKVFLELWVKVQPGWTSNPVHARRLVNEVEQS
ncbi:MAG: GTPase Era [Polyangiales bacterium]